MLVLPGHRCVASCSPPRGGGQAGAVRPQPARRHEVWDRDRRVGGCGTVYGYCIGGSMPLSGR
ncbi:hypothetical protein GCM10009827_119190 [Dactylosporangium maewongense]|uniref:Uncharacterized protein n=1 Tax=Dactylosporangium maewongense TaxID=634393 RepID=A0ABN2DHD4_9ACTN